MKAIKRCASLGLCLAVLISGLIFSTSAANIPAADKSAVYIEGYPDGSFLPEKKMTRAEAVKVTAVICGYDGKNANDSKSSFTDVAGDEWFVTYLTYLEDFGMTDLFGEKFSPQSEITRAEFVALISPLIPVAEGDKKFPDVNSSHGYYKEIIKAANAGLIMGDPDGSFAPDRTLKRAEIVTVLNRLLERNPIDNRIEELYVFSDVDSHWAKPQIAAASLHSNTVGITIWYTGKPFASNSPVDSYPMDFSTTKAVLDGAKSDSAEDVEKSVEAYAEKRRREIANTPTNVKVTGTSYYVSENGDDANDGKSPESPWKTLKKVSEAKLESGDGVFFKRGDTFRGQLLTTNGVTYSAYGEGEKPHLYGSLRNYSESDFWDETDKENVYVSKEAFELDVGLIVFGNDEAVSVKKTEGIDGKEITKDLEMNHNTEDRKIYLYSVSDPDERFDKTEICVYGAVIAGKGTELGTDVVIDNLYVKYAGCGGVGYDYGINGVTVQNCIFGWIGGSLLDSETRIVRCGNAVGTYGTCKKFTVDNCHIYQIYDAGISHQYFGKDKKLGEMQYITYTDNVIEYCTWNFEVINSAPEGYMRDVDISGNLILYAGDGWGVQRPYDNPCGLMHRAGKTGLNLSNRYYIYDNIIYTRNVYAALMDCGAKTYEDMPLVKGNLFLGVKDNPFGMVGLSNSYKTVFYSERKLKKTVGLDDNYYFYLEEE